MLPLYSVDRPYRWPMITYSLIVVNAIVFVWELAVTSGFYDSCATNQLFYTYGFVPNSVINGSQISFNCANPALSTATYTPTVYFSPLSSMFLHAGWEHIIGNMIFLFVFGPNIEARFGRVKYLGLYLAAGLAGSVATTLAALATSSNMMYIPAVGASGAISGVLGAYFVLLPRSRIISVVGYFVMPIRAFWLIGGWFLLQVLYQLTGVDTGVAYVAHIGGFGLGVALGLIVREMGGSRESEYDPYAAD